MIEAIRDKVESVQEARKLRVFVKYNDAYTIINIPEEVLHVYPESSRNYITGLQEILSRASAVVDHAQEIRQGTFSSEDPVKGVVDYRYENNPPRSGFAVMLQSFIPTPYPKKTISSVIEIVGACTGLDENQIEEKKQYAKDINNRGKYEVDMGKDWQLHIDHYKTISNLNYLDVYMIPKDKEEYADVE
jgi:hypothetical protein